MTQGTSVPGLNKKKDRKIKVYRVIDGVPSIIDLRITTHSFIYGGL